VPAVLRKALDEVNELWERIGQRQVEAQDEQQRARDEEAKQPHLTKRLQRRNQQASHRKLAGYPQLPPGC
jgi:hypothetical protein